MRFFNSRDPPPAPAMNSHQQQSGFMRRVPNSVGGRWAFMFVCLVGTIWGIVMGVAALEDRGDVGASNGMKTAGLVLAIMYFIVAAIEIIGVLISFKASPKIVRLFVVLAPVALAVAAGSQVVRFILHFTLKGAIIQQCVTEELQGTWVNRLGQVVDITEEIARADCNSSWTRSTWILVVWIIVVLLIGLMFFFSARAFQRQVSDPNSGRVHNVQQSFGMQGMAPPPPPPASGYQGWEVPPYPGPPQNAAPPPAGGYEKSDYQPDADWARAEYAAPPGSPPAQSSRPPAGFVIPNDEEEEAWRRAREEGVTAHLTGGGVPAGLREDREARAAREREGTV